MEFYDYFRARLSENPLVVIFCSILVASFILMLILAISTRGWFLKYALDLDFSGLAFGDHFDSMKYSVDHPYSAHHVIYPPLITGIYAIFGWIALPYVDDDTADLSYQFYQSSVGMTGLILFMLLGLILICYLISYILDNEKKTGYTTLLCLCMFLSSPFIYGLERGNCIFYSVAFMMIFIFGYSSDNGRLRIVSYISLGIATGIKLFPIIFVSLLLRDRRYGDFLICSSICAVILLLPFIFFDGTPLTLIESIFNYSVSSENGGGMYKIDQWITVLCINILGRPVPYLGTIITGALLVISIILIIVDKDMPFWQVVLLICCNMCIGFAIPTAYIYLNLVPAIVLLLKNNSRIGTSNIVDILLLSGVFSVLTCFGFVKSACILVILVKIVTNSLRRVSLTTHYV